MKRRIVIVGSRGHARAVSDVVRSEGRFQVEGLIDSTRQKGSKASGIMVLGGVSEIASICGERGISAVAVAIGDNCQRERLTGQIREEMKAVEFVVCVHPSAVIGANVTIGAGSVVMPSVTIVSGSVIGEGCVLNTGSILDHDGILESWASLASGGVVGGSVRVGRRSFVGLGAQVRHKVSIGPDTVVGAGAVVLSDLPGGVVAYGVPCKVIRRRQVDDPYL